MFARSGEELTGTWSVASMKEAGQGRGIENGIGRLDDLHQRSDEHQYSPTRMQQ